MRGRCTLLRSCNSSRRRSAPPTVIGTLLMPYSPMQLLQRPHLRLFAEAQCHAHGLAPGECRGVIHIVIFRTATNRGGVFGGLSPFCGIYNHVDLFILYYIISLRSTFLDYVT